MLTIITSLPHATNDGRATGYERAMFFRKLQADGVRFSVQTPCTGFWYADDGKLYSEETTLVMMTGSETAIRNAVAGFGEMAGQLEMLFVERKEGSVVATGNGREDAAYFAKLYGGATLLPNNQAVTLNYTSLVAGEHYSAAFVTR